MTLSIGSRPTPWNTTAFIFSSPFGSITSNRDVRGRVPVSPSLRKPSGRLLPGYSSSALSSFA